MEGSKLKECLLYYWIYMKTPSIVMYFLRAKTLTIVLYIPLPSIKIPNKYIERENKVYNNKKINDRIKKSIYILGAKINNQKYI